MKVCDILICRKDYYHFYWNGCLYNGDPGKGITPTFENKNEMDEFPLVGGQSYYFKNYIKGVGYEIMEVVVIKEYTYYRINNEHIKDTECDASLSNIEELKKYFYIGKELRKKKLDEISQVIFI